MPYIKEDRRQSLDTCIENMISCLSHQDNDDISNVLGDINYCFSRVLSGVMKQPSYNKIAMITGVLENIKQEFYRRVASPYEDKKILENGDIKEYKKL
jgi:flagellin-specific chaperone FliS